MKIVTPRDIQEMNELYKQELPYAVIARRTGFSPATVRKYINPDYVSPVTIIRFTGVLPEFDPQIFRCADWGPLCELTPDEEQAIIKLWEEMEF